VDTVLEDAYTFHISVSPITLFFKTNFIRTRGSFFAQNLRTIPASAEEQNSSKCRTISKVHFASSFSTYNYSSQLCENKQKFHVAYLTSWNNSIFGYKLRTIEAENP